MVLYTTSSLASAIKTGDRKFGGTLQTTQCALKLKLKASVVEGFEKSLPQPGHQHICSPRVLYSFLVNLSKESCNHKLGC